MLTQVTDLGTLKFGKPHSFNFRIKNTGGKGLEVTKLAVGCTSCTRADMPKKYIGPTEEAVINVVFTPGSLGHNRKSVTVAYHEGSLRLEFIANVES